MVTRGAVWPSRSPGGFAAVYPVLAALEERGRGPPGLLRRGAGRGPVRGARCGGPAAGAAPSRPTGGRGGGRRARSCSPRPTRPTRTARRCPGRSGWSTRATAQPRRTGHRAGARPAPWWCWSAATWCSTSSGAAGPCCPSATTRPAGGRGASAEAVRPGAGRDLGGAGRRRGDPDSTLRKPCRRPASGRPRAACGYAPEPLASVPAQRAGRATWRASDGRLCDGRLGRRAEAVRWQAGRRRPGDGRTRFNHAAAGAPR